MCVQEAMATNAPQNQGHLKGTNMQFTRNTRKFKSNSFMATTALGLTLVAGMPSSAHAEPDREKSHQQKTNQPHMNDREGTSNNKELLHFARSGDLIGSELYNNTGDSIGTITDFIVDRGSGRIVFGIVQSGDFLGIGGSEVALGYNEIRYVPVGKTYRTNMTKQELTRRTEYLPENWNDLRQTSWMDRVGNWVDGQDRDRNTEMTLRDAVTRGEQQELQGKVIRVSRESVMGEDYVSATIRDESGNERKVLVGPSWFISGADYAIHRDDEVDIQAVEHDMGWIAVDGDINGHEVAYRDSEGNGRWVSSRENQPRYVLLSDLTGDSIEMTGSTVGEIQTVLVEAASGQIGFIGFDPNENLFGLGDEISIIPWQSLSMIDNSAFSLDSNEAELAQAMTMPESLDMLRNRETVNAAYSIFGQDAPKFPHSPAMSSTKNKRTSMNDGQERRVGDAWARESTLVRAFADGKEVKIEGKFKGMSTKSIVEGAPAASVIMIETKDGTKTVIVGPEWYTNRQRIDLNSGDTIVVHARRAEYNGQQWHAASSIERDGDSWVFWDDDAPMWSN